MHLEFALSAIVLQMAQAKVLRLLAREGERLGIGAGLLELEVDLSNLVSHDCPPVSHYRIVLREAAYLRRWAVSVGEIVPVGGLIAQLSHALDEAIDEGDMRRVRVNVAGIIPNWDEIA
jgi:hypothetical protein